MRTLILVAILLLTLPLLSAWCQDDGCGLCDCITSQQHLYEECFDLYSYCTPDASCQGITECSPIGEQGSCAAGETCTYHGDVDCTGALGRTLTLSRTTCEPNPDPVCGNGVVETGEQCEPGDTTPCDAQLGTGYEGTVTCTNCQWDTTTCTEATPSCATQGGDVCAVAAECQGVTVAAADTPCHPGAFARGDCSPLNPQSACCLGTCDATCTSTLPTGALCTDGTPPANRCSAEQDARAATAANLLDGHYARLSDRLSGTASEPERYPAALHYFTRGRDNEANTLIEAELAHGAPDPLGAAYLAWLERMPGLSAANRAGIAAALDALAVDATREEDRFLQLVARHLHDDGNDAQESCRRSEPLALLLRANGDGGWQAEASPARAVRLVVALAALRAESAEPGLRALADAQLDLLFARYAALDAAGTWGGVRTHDAAPYAPTQSPWYGWRHWLLGPAAPPDLTFTEPALLASGYCTNQAVHAIAEHQDDPARAIGSRETYAGVNGRAHAISTADYVLAATQDADARLAAPLTTRATLRFKDDPLSLVLFTSRTSPDYSEQTTDAGTVIMPEGEQRGILLGSLGGTTCQEGHAFVGTGFEVIPSYGMENELTLLYQQATSTYVAIRFLGGQQVLETYERYAPLAGSIPATYATYGTDERSHRGLVIVPDDPRGIFSLEIIPEAFVNSVPPDLLPAAVLSNTSLVFLDAETLSYRTTLQGAPKEYRYNLNTLAATKTTGSGEAPLDLGPYAPRGTYRVPLPAGTPPIAYANGAWDFGRTLLDANGNAIARRETIDFNAATLDGLKRAINLDYACADAPPANDPPPGDAQVITPEERLGFLAASLLDDAGSAYVLDCGPDVLPRAARSGLGDLIHSACAFSTATERTVGLVYDESAGPFRNILLAANSYWPYLKDPISDTRAAMCDDIDDTTETTDFIKCGQLYEGSTPVAHVYLSPNDIDKHGVLVISTDANPFTNGPLDGILDYLAGLFSDTASGTDGDELGAGYFYRDGDVRVDARLQGEAAELTYDGLGDVHPLLSDFPHEYTVSDGVQRVTVPEADGARWRSLTAQLRIDPSAVTAPPADVEYCGNGIIDTLVGEECDGDLVRETCVSLDPAQYAGGTPTCLADCTGYDESTCDPIVCFDDDGDGYYGADACGTEKDCDDADATVNPGAVEICNDVLDNNCDGFVNGLHENAASSDHCDPSEVPGAPVDLFTCDSLVDASCPYVCG